MKNTFSKVPKDAKTPMNADLMDSPQKDLYIAKKVDVKIKRLNGTTMFTILFALFLLIIGVAVGTTYSAFQNTAQSNGTLSFAINGHQGTLNLSNTKVASYNSTDLTLIFTLSSDENYSNPAITNISMGGDNLEISGVNFTSGSNVVATYSSSTLTIYRAEVTGNLVITGSSIAQTYTITYNANGGSGTMADTTANYNSFANLRANTFTRTGYAFGGWSTTAGGIVEYVDGAKVKDIGNTTLYAKWAANELTFNNQNKSATFSSTAQNIIFTGANNGTGSYTYSITAGNDDSYFSISGATITAVANAPVGSYNLAITATDGASAKTRTVIIAITINPITLGIPTVSISNIGVVTWNTITGASSYDISIDGTTWTSGVNSGYDYFNTIVAGSGTRTVRVRANPSANYDASKVGSASITTYAITVAGANGTVRVSRTNNAGNATTLNFLPNATAYIFATANSHYHFVNWTKSGGNAPASTTTANTTVVVSASSTYTANIVINTYTVTIARNNNSYGTVSHSSVANVPYGTVISTNGATANINGTTVTATAASQTAQYNYAFSNWTNGTATVTGDITVTANFTQSTRMYTINFYQHGSFAKSVSVPYNQPVWLGAFYRGAPICEARLGGSSGETLAGAPGAGAIYVNGSLIVSYPNDTTIYITGTTDINFVAL